MNLWITFAAIVAAGLATGMGVCILRFLRGHEDSADLPELDTGGSLERYKVMERLLSSSDLDFLASQPGFKPEMAAKWKRESLCVFRIYLRELTRDFHSLHARARKMVADSGSHSPELAATLVRQRVTFLQARMILEWHLLLFRFGAPRVDVGAILDLVTAMQVDLSRVAPDPAGTL